MDAEQLRERTKGLAGVTIRFVDTLQRGMAFEVIGKQLIRSATSVAANYRAACRARSQADFVNKIGIVAEEADETVFWFEMLLETKKIPEESVKALLGEAKEIAAIFTASNKTARTNRMRKKS